MHPGFFQWWKGHRHGGDGVERVSCGVWRGHGHHGGGPGHGHGEGPGQWAGPAGDGEGPFSGFGGGGSFGVRRPLRFMAHKLDLREDQVTELAALLDDLKTERAQAEVDYRRTVGAFADAVSGATFDAKKAEDAGKARVASAERVRAAVQRTLEKTHALLDDEQRKKLAYLLRSGALTI